MGLLPEVPMSAGRVYRPKVRRTYDPQHSPHFDKCSVAKGCYFETSVWWLKYYVRGKVHFESSRTSSKRDAQRLLRDRLSARESGRLIGQPDTVTFADLRRGIEQHYDRQGNRSKDRAALALDHLEKFFLQDALALDITPARVADYIDARLAARPAAARATVRYEIMILTLGFTVAVKAGLLALRPIFTAPIVRNARSGFFSEADIAALLIELPDYLRPVANFGRLTGWRKDEVVGLTWGHIDWEAETIRLRADETKGKVGRVFPFGLAPALRELLRAEWAQRRGPFVFQDHGNPIKTFYKAWKSACKRAGLEGRLFHDLRRTAARELRKAGLTEGEIMKLCGWKTRSMFDRYNIIDEQDLAAAVAKRFAEPAKEDAR